MTSTGSRWGCSSPSPSEEQPADDCDAGEAPNHADKPKRAISKRDSVFASDATTSVAMNQVVTGSSLLRQSRVLLSGFLPMTGYTKRYGEQMILETWELLT